MVNTVPSDYVTGTITLTNGSAAFTGTGTGWLAMMFRQGDMILDLPDAPEYIAIIDEVTTNTAGTLTRPWLGPTLTGAYRMRYQWDAGRVTAMSAFLREELGNGNLQAFAALVGSAGGVPVFIGPGAMEVRPASDFVNGVAYDVQVDTLADRAAFDGQSEGFSVLVSDTGDGRSALFSKASATVADWTDPAYITGPIGASPNFAAGTTTTVPPGTPADVDLVPDGSGGFLFDFDIPAGEGFVSRGAYSGATDYVKGDVVQNNGSSWVAKIATTGNAPPVLPTTSNTWWELLAAAGINGTGTVTSIVAGDGIAVDNTDPENPVVSFDGVAGPVLATEAEAVAGTDNLTYMSPLRVRQVINSLFGLAPALTRWAAANAQVRKFYGGNAPTVDTNSTGGALAAGRTLINNTIVDGIRQDGLIRSVSLNINAAGSLSNSVRFQVRRANGANWDIVASSEYFTPAGTGYQTFNLSTPMACAPGDKVAVWLKGDATNGPRVGVKTGGGTFIYADGETTTTGPWTSVNFILGMTFNGVPPFAIVTGDSIQEGHNTATNWHSFYHTGPAGDINAEPFHSLRGLVGTGFEYQNFAEGSTNWSQTLAKAPAIAAVAPKMVLALCGVNDIVQNRTWAQVLSDLNAFKAALPSGTVLFISELLPYTPGTDAQALTIRTWNTNLAGWCAANGANLVLCHDAMGQIRPSTGQLDDLVTAYHYSGGHLSTAGIAAYAALMNTGVQSILWM